MKVVLKRFHLKGHTTGFLSQTQKLHIDYDCITDSEE